MEMRINGKILLFGEYLLLKGSMGLALPLNKYSGQLVLPSEETILNHTSLDSNATIKKLAIELSQHSELKHKPNMHQFLEDALCGLYFDSEIPQNYGLGSSGAVVAAIYKKYFAPVKKIDPNNLTALRILRKELASIEAYFHGSSSGTDPLISYLNQALILNAPIHIKELNAPSTFSTVLIDTKIASSTKSFIEVFTTKAKLQKNEITELIRLNNESIISLAQNNSSSFNHIKDFCNKEQEIFSEMFVYPKGLQNILNEHKNSFCTKLCGSGGGGYLLGFIKNTSAKNIFSELYNHGIYYESFTIPESKLLLV